MRQAAIGDTVRVHYTGTLDDGTEFDSSAGRDPLEIQIGSKQIIPGLEDALVGMAEGEAKSVTLQPDDAYGPHDPQFIQVVARDRIPPEIDLQVGTLLQATDGGGNQMRVQVVEVNDSEVTLDANHPLAGKALTFALTLVGFVA